MNYLKPQTDGRAGFTLMELLAVVGLLGAIFGIAAPMAWSYVQRSDAQIAAATVAQTLRRAQELAARMHSDSAWGVRLEGNAVILFAGNSYGSRNAELDETAPLPAGIGASGSSEVVFSKKSGAAAETTLLIRNSLHAPIPVIVRENGMVEY